jgi:putative FmdB family regulatory protein
VPCRKEPPRNTISQADRRGPLAGRSQHRDFALGRILLSNHPFSGRFNDFPASSSQPPSVASRLGQVPPRRQDRRRTVESMLTYEYECGTCGRRFERRQAVTDDSVERCEVCGARVRRVVSGGGEFIITNTGSERSVLGSRCSFEQTGRCCCGRDQQCEKPLCECLDRRTARADGST